LVFEKNANFFAENWQKSQKIVIITSTPDWGEFSPTGRLRNFLNFENYKSGQKFFGQLFSALKVALNLPEMGRATFWAIRS
jgi:hypothetical protein